MREADERAAVMEFKPAAFNLAQDDQIALGAECAILKQIVVAQQALALALQSHLLGLPIGAPLARF